MTQTTDPQPTTARADRVRKLEAMARQWDRCAANAPTTTNRMRSPAETYRGYAAECRRKAERLAAGDDE